MAQLQIFELVDTLEPGKKAKATLLKWNGTVYSAGAERRSSSTALPAATAYRAIAATASWATRRVGRWSVR